MRKPLQSWWTTWFKLGFVRKRPEKRRREHLNRRPQVETLEKREVFTVNVSNFGLVNDTGTAGDLITSDPRVSAAISGSFMGTATIQFDHNGDGNVDGSASVSSSGQMITYDPRVTQPSLNSYTGSFPLRYRTMEYVMPSGQQVFGSWTNFTFTITSASSQPNLQVRDSTGTPLTNNGSAISFGSTNTGVSVDKTFVIANQGQGTLTISSWTAPSGFQIVGSPPSSVAAGGQANVTVRLTASASGYYSGQVTFSSNDSANSPFRINVSGDVATTAPQMEVRLDGNLVADNSGVAHFGSAVAGSPVTKTFTIQNWGNSALTINTGTISVPSGFTLVSTPSATVAAAGGSTTFQVRLNASAVGSYSGRLSISTNDPAHNPYDFDIDGTVVAAVPEIVVNYNPGSGNVDVADNTATVNFGSTLLGQQVQRTFVVQNTGNTALTLGSISLPSGFTLVTAPSSSVAAGGSTYFVVALNGAAGTYSGQLTFTTNDADENPFNFQIQGTITPPPPDIGLELVINGSGNQTIPSTGGSVSFGTAYLNETKTQTINIRNFGGSTLNISSITLPTGFQLAAAAPTTVAANSTVAIVVRMLGDTSGTRSGNLVIVSDDPDESPLSVALSGQVLDVAPKIEVRETSAGGAVVSDGTGSINWGDIDVNTTSNKTFYISNVGSVALTLNSGSLSLPNGFTVQQGFATSLDPGASTALIIRFAPTQSQTYSGTLSFSTNDPTASTFDFTITGGGIIRPAEIEVKNGTVDLVDGTSTVDVGSTYLGSPVNKTITIKNTGGVALTIDTGSFVVPTGFTIVSLPAASVAAGDSTTFVVRLTGAALGNYSGTLRFSSSDADESPFDITLTGAVLVDPWTVPGSVSNVYLQNDTGTSGSDKVTADSRIRGTVVGVLNGGTARVEFDHDGDGGVDGSTVVTDGWREFIYDGRLSDPLLVTRSGAWTANYRVVKVDTSGADGPVSGWTSFNMTLAPNPIAITGLGLAVDDGITRGDRITSTPTISGLVTGEFAAGTVKIEFDHNGDGTVDGFRRVSAISAHFDYAPLESDPGFAAAGAKTVRLRTVLESAGGAAVATSGWGSFSFELEDAASPAATQVELVTPAFGTNGADGFIESYSPTLDVLIRRGADAELVQVDFDFDGDGIADSTVNLPVLSGVFRFDPRALTQSPNLSAGIHHWSIRTRSFDADGDPLEQGEWASFAFRLLSDPAPSVQLLTLQLDGGAVGAGGILHTTSPVVKGTVQLPTTQVGAPFDLGNVNVEIDVDGNGVADTICPVTNGPSGAGFVQGLPNLSTGSATVRVRLIEWAADRDVWIVGNWTSLTFVVDAPIGSTITGLGLVSDNGVSATDGKTSDPRISGHVVNGDTTTSMVELEIDGSTTTQLVTFSASGDFEFDLSSAGVGGHIVRARVVRYDGDNSVVSNWAVLSFETVLAPLPTISNFVVLDPILDANGAVVNAAPRVAVTLANGSLTGPIYVEIDTNHDGTAEHFIETHAGNTIDLVPAIKSGAIELRARLVIWDPVTNGFRSGSWTTLGFQWNPPLAAAPSWSVRLANPVSPSSPSSATQAVFTGQVGSSGWIEIDTDGTPANIVRVFADESGVWKYVAPYSVGQHNLHVRLGWWDAQQATVRHGAWSDFAFTIVSPPNAPPAIAQLSVVSASTGSGGGLTTPNPTIYGQVTNDGSVSQLVVEFDLDGNGTVDATTVTDSEGRFQYRPEPLALGAVTIAVRARETNPSTGNPQFSAWSNLSFTLVDEPIVAASVQSLTTLQTPNSSGQVTDSTIVGTVRGGARTDDVEIELDINGDGVAEQTVGCDVLGQFQISPTSIGFGVHTLRVRTTRLDVSNGQSLRSAWQSITINFVAPSPPTAQIDALQLDGATGAAADNTPIGPKGKVKGQLSGTVPLDGIRVEFDTNNDGTVDVTVRADADGKFSNEFTGLADGRHTIRARARYLGEDSVLQFSAWKTFEFETDTPESTAPEILWIKLANDTGASATDRATANPSVAVKGVRLPASAVVRFDADGDGLIDGTATFNTNGEATWNPTSFLRHGIVNVRATLDDPSDPTVKPVWKSLAFVFDETPDGAAAQSAASGLSAFEANLAASETQRAQAEQDAKESLENSLRGIDDDQDDDVSNSAEARLAARQAAEAGYRQALAVAGQAYSQSIAAAQQALQNNLAAYQGNKTAYSSLNFAWPDAPPDPQYSPESFNAIVPSVGSGTSVSIANDPSVLSGVAQANATLASGQRAASRAYDGAVSASERLKAAEVAAASRALEAELRRIEAAYSRATTRPYQSTAGGISQPPSSGLPEKEPFEKDIDAKVEAKQAEINKKRDEFTAFKNSEGTKQSNWINEIQNLKQQVLSNPLAPPVDDQLETLAEKVRASGEEVGKALKDLAYFEADAAVQIAQWRAELQAWKLARDTASALAKVEKTRTADHQYRLAVINAKEAHDSDVAQATSKFNKAVAAANARYEVALAEAGHSLAITSAQLRAGYANQVASIYASAYANAAAQVGSIEAQYQANLAQNQAAYIQTATAAALSMAISRANADYARSVAFSAATKTAAFAESNAQATKVCDDADATAQCAREQENASFDNFQAEWEDRNALNVKLLGGAITSGDSQGSGFTASLGIEGDYFAALAKANKKMLEGMADAQFEFTKTIVGIQKAQLKTITPTQAQRVAWTQQTADAAKTRAEADALAMQFRDYDESGAREKRASDRATAFEEFHAANFQRQATLDGKIGDSEKALAEAMAATDAARKSTVGNAATSEFASKAYASLAWSQTVANATIDQFLATKTAEIQKWAADQGAYSQYITQLAMAQASAINTWSSAVNSSFSAAQNAIASAALTRVMATVTAFGQYVSAVSQSDLAAAQAAAGANRTNVNNAAAAQGANISAAATLQYQYIATSVEREKQARLADIGLSSTRANAERTRTRAVYMKDTTSYAEMQGEVNNISFGLDSAEYNLANATYAHNVKLADIRNKYERVLYETAAADQAAQAVMAAAISAESTRYNSECNTIKVDAQKAIVGSQADDMARRVEKFGQVNNSEISSDAASYTTAAEGHATAQIDILNAAASHQIALIGLGLNLTLTLNESERVTQIANLQTDRGSSVAYATAVGNFKVAVSHAEGIEQISVGQALANYQIASAQERYSRLITAPNDALAVYQKAVALADLGWTVAVSGASVTYTSMVMQAYDTYNVAMLSGANGIETGLAIAGVNAKAAAAVAGVNLSAAYYSGVTQVAATYEIALVAADQALQVATINAEKVFATARIEAARTGWVVENAARMTYANGAIELWEPYQKQVVAGENPGALNLTALNTGLQNGFKNANEAYWSLAKDDAANKAEAIGDAQIAYATALGAAKVAGVSVTTSLEAAAEGAGQQIERNLDAAVSSAHISYVDASGAVFVGLTSDLGFASVVLTEALALGGTALAHDVAAAEAVYQHAVADSVWARYYVTGVPPQYTLAGYAYYRFAAYRDWIGGMGPAFTSLVTGLSDAEGDWAVSVATNAWQAEVAAATAWKIYHSAEARAGAAISAADIAAAQTFQSTVGQLMRSAANATAAAEAVHMVGVTTSLVESSKWLTSQTSSIFYQAAIGNTQGMAHDLAVAYAKAKLMAEVGESQGGDGDGIAGADKTLDLTNSGITNSLAHASLNAWAAYVGVAAQLESTYAQSIAPADQQLMTSLALVGATQAIADQLAENTYVLVTGQKLANWIGAGYTQHHLAAAGIHTAMGLAWTGYEAARQGARADWWQTGGGSGAYLAWIQQTNAAESAYTESTVSAMQIWVGATAQLQSATDIQIAGIYASLQTAQATALTSAVHPVIDAQAAYRESGINYAYLLRCFNANEAYRLAVDPNAVPGTPPDNESVQDAAEALRDATIAATVEYTEDMAGIIVDAVGDLTQALGAEAVGQAQADSALSLQLADAERDYQIAIANADGIFARNSALSWKNAAETLWNGNGTPWAKFEFDKATAESVKANAESTATSSYQTSVANLDYDFAADLIAAGEAAAIASANATLGAWNDAAASMANYMIAGAQHVAQLASSSTSPVAGTYGMTQASGTPNSFESGLGSYGGTLPLDLIKANEHWGAQPVGPDVPMNTFAVSLANSLGSYSDFLRSLYPPPPEPVYSDAPAAPPFETVDVPFWGDPLTWIVNSSGIYSKEYIAFSSRNISPAINSTLTAVGISDAQLAGASSTAMITGTIGVVGTLVVGTVVTGGTLAPAATASALNYVGGALGVAALQSLGEFGTHLVINGTASGFHPADSYAKNALIALATKGIGNGFAKFAVDTAVGTGFDVYVLGQNPLKAGLINFGGNLAGEAIGGLLKLGGKAFARGMADTAATKAAKEMIQLPNLKPGVSQAVDSLVSGVNCQTNKSVLDALGRAIQSEYGESAADRFFARLACFPKGTLVSAERGQVPIEQIVQGERVWSCDVATGKWHLKEVAATMIRPYQAEMISVELETETIRSTDLHPFWVVEGEELDSRPKPGHVSEEEWEQLPDTGTWVNARDLREGDVLLKQDGTTETVRAVRAAWVTEHVYNFEVADSHNYAVGLQRVLVHNATYGEEGERWARNWLKNNGFDVLGQIKNNSGHGLDIFARARNTGELVIVEVKTRSNVFGGLSNRQSSMGVTRYAIDILQKLRDGNGHWSSRNVQWGGANLARGLLAEINSGGTVRGLLLQINEAGRRIRAIPW